MNKRTKTRIDEEDGKNIIIVTSISAALILLLILLFASFKVYLFPYIDLPGSMDAWIGASASIAGGALAFGGVWWTISNQNKKRKEDLLIQYEPLLNFSFSKTEVMKSGIVFSRLKISNDSNSTAFNINYSANFPKQGYAIVFPEKQNFHNIPSHKSQFLSIIICKPKKRISANQFSDIIPFSDKEEFKFNIEITYNHPLNEKIQYKTILECILENVVIEEDMFNVYDISDINNVKQIKKVSIIGIKRLKKIL